MATNLQADLVFEAGGIKAVALAGAYRVLSDRGFVPACVAGSSGGAIVAALIAAGYTGAELEALVLRELPWPQLADAESGRRLAPPGISASAGLHSGNYLLGWMREHLRAKGLSVLGDLRTVFADVGDPTEEEPRRYRLQLLVSNLTTRQLMILPRDAPALGLDPDKMEIAETVRMSMSIPGFYGPVRVSRPGEPEQVVVDGSVLSNFPVWLFDHRPKVPPVIPTFGIKTVPGVRGNSPRTGSRATSPESDRNPLGGLARALGSLASERSDSLELDAAHASRTIFIPAPGVRSTDFESGPGANEQLFSSGVSAAERFLSTWNFDAYIRRFRSGPPADAS